MEKEKIKEAFSKVKEDMLILGNKISQIKLEIHEINQLLTTFHDQLNTQKLHEITKKNISTFRHINSTFPTTPTHTSTHPQEAEGLKNQNLSISTGNRGVSTDRQTDTSTDISPLNLIENPSQSIENNIQEASKIIESLDYLRKEIRRKFKKLTPQEMKVFSTIYQLEDQAPSLSNYKQISIKLGLSESSIRDYVQRMISKGIPIKKYKIDNKKITLSISQELKKIATLSTIIQLREL